MRRLLMLSTFALAGWAMRTDASFAGRQVQLVQDEAKPGAPLPPTRLTPDTEIIKPKTDPDPKIEKTPPNPDPDPSNKDVIEPPKELQPK